MSSTENVTQYLSDLRSGDSKAGKKLTPIIIEELHRLAKYHMRQESLGHTLQATALVNEAYLKLVEMNVDWKSRAHFFAIAAKQMRRILIDHARKKLANKRGGEFQQVTFDESLSFNQDNNEQLIEIDRMLLKLQNLDQKAARFFELRLFGGLSNQEIAEVENVSLSSVEREIRISKAWLLNELKNEG